MALNSRDYLVLVPYRPTSPPEDPRSLKQYFHNELEKLSATVAQIAEAAPQAADTAPRNPRRGTIRLNVLPWNPTGDGAEGLVWWNGTSWRRITSA